MSALFIALAAAVERAPFDTAIVGDDRTYSYMSLLESVKNLAREMYDGQHAAVLILGEKCAATVVFQLACNAAQQVFVPCDAATPSGRLQGIIERVRPRLILDTPEADHSQRGYVRQGRWLGHDVWRSASFLTYANSVSHIVFSSGSTGSPKAILLPDEPVAPVVREQARRLGLGPGARFAWLLSPSFDASLSDIYATLFSGATLHVCSFGMSQVKTLKTYFQKHSITHTDLSPALLPILAPEELPALRAVVMGGELAQEAAVRAWAAAGKRMFNAYGPTEATICTSLKDVDDAWTPTNIGKPLPGVEYQVEVEGEFLLAQPGLRGELWIAGEHLACGYDNAELNEARFVASAAGRRYKTGDLVAVDSLGDFHFLGRVDRQLKFHGVLICPEELEALARRAGCSEAVFRLEGKKLVLHFAGPLEERELKIKLGESLLTTMMPHRFIKHEKLAKSLSGKVAL